MKVPDVEYVPFPEEQYYRREGDKKQIVLHHTVSGDGVEGDINWWLSTPDRIATAFIIARDGVIYQNFNSKYWAHHLGIKMSVFNSHGIDPGGANVKLNINSIGIELDSWGPLKNPDMVKDPVQYEGGYRGYEWYEAYTEQQLDSLKELLEYLCAKYEIPVTYNEDMWDVSVRALNGEPGIWSHTSYRPDKSDVHPQPTLIDILNNLNA